MKRWMDVLNHKKKWIPILDSLEAMTLAVIITTTTTTTTTNSPQTTGETYSVKSALAIFLPSYFCCFFQAPHMQHLPSTEFRKAELSWFLLALAQTIRNGEMPIILEKQMDIFNHKHLRTTQMLQFGTKYGNLSPTECLSILMGETTKDRGKGRKDYLGWKMKILAEMGHLWNEKFQCSHGLQNWMWGDSILISIL